MKLIETGVRNRPVVGLKLVLGTYTLRDFQFKAFVPSTIIVSMSKVPLSCILLLNLGEEGLLIQKLHFRSTVQ